MRVDDTPISHVVDGNNDEEIIQELMWPFLLLARECTWYQPTAVPEPLTRCKQHIRRFLALQFSVLWTCVFFLFPFAKSEDGESPPGGDKSKKLG